jgi:hypothetical protein
VATLLVIFKLLPGILAAVQGLEVALPIPAAGKAKLDLILGIVSDVSSADQSIGKLLPGDQLVSVITSTVSRIVSAFNSLGVFNKATAVKPTA